MHLAFAHIHCLAGIDARLRLGVAESDWIRRVGVLIALIGAGVAAPNGLFWLMQTTRSTGISVWLKFRAVLGYPVTRHMTDVDGGMAVMLAKMTVGAEAMAWSPNASADEKADLLYKQMVEAYQKIESVRRECETRDGETRALIEGRAGKLEASYHELRRLLEAQEHWEARVDGRGLLLIGLGILLTGVPDELAAFALIGWLMVAFSALSAVVIVLAVRSDRDQAG
jgi:hypothetical protein